MPPGGGRGGAAGSESGWLGRPPLAHGTRPVSPSAGPVTGVLQPLPCATQATEIRTIDLPPPFRLFGAGARLYGPAPALSPPITRYPLCAAYSVLTFTPSTTAERPSA